MMFLIPCIGRPLLNESVADDDDVIKISRRHLAFILRSLDEATNLLRDHSLLQNELSILLFISHFLVNLSWM